jgi:hypothetical protein
MKVKQKNYRFIQPGINEPSSRYRLRSLHSDFHTRRPNFLQKSSFDRNWTQRWKCGYVNLLAYHFIGIKADEGVICKCSIYSYSMLGRQPPLRYHAMILVDPWLSHPHDDAEALEKVRLYQLNGTAKRKNWWENADSAVKYFSTKAPYDEWDKDVVHLYIVRCSLPAFSTRLTEYIGEGTSSGY